MTAIFPPGETNSAQDPPHPWRVSHPALVSGEKGVATYQWWVVERQEAVDLTLTDLGDHGAVVDRLLWARQEPSGVWTVAVEVSAQ